MLAIGHEMPGLIGQGAHIAGRHVEQQVVVIKPVGQAPTHIRGGVDHCDFRWSVRGIPSQMEGCEGTAEPSANNCNVLGGGHQK